MIHKYSHLLKKSNYKSTKPVMMSCELILLLLLFFFLNPRQLKVVFSLKPTSFHTRGDADISYTTPRPPFSANVKTVMGEDKQTHDQCHILEQNPRMRDQQ